MSRRSRSAFLLTLLGSILVLGDQFLVLGDGISPFRVTFRLFEWQDLEWRDLPWTIVIPVVITAFPLIAVRAWARILAAFLMTLWTWSGAGLPYYLLGWVASLAAAVQPDPRVSQDASHRDRRSVRGQ